MRKLAVVLMRKFITMLMADTVDDIKHEIRKLDENNQALHYLDCLLRPCEPWTGWAMQPSGVATVVSDILINARHMVVECGAGLSTLYAAKAVSQQGGLLVSFESDLAWAERIRRKAADLDLAPHVDVVYAELSDWRYQNRLYRWYDVGTVLEKMEGKPPIDLLVVDGPPGPICEHARYPAVPVLRPYLDSSRYAIILDDIDRRDEREIVDRWKRDLSAEFINDYKARGISYGRAGSYYTV